MGHVSLVIADHAASIMTRIIKFSVIKNGALKRNTLIGQFCQGKEQGLINNNWNTMHLRINNTILNFQVILEDSN